MANTFPDPPSAHGNAWLLWVWIRVTSLGSLLIGPGLPAWGLVPIGPPAFQEKAPVTPRTEYEMKAFFMVNFARFVEWPHAADASGEIGIGILGRDPVGSALEPYTGQLVKGRRIVIRRGKEVKDLGDCRILFIGETSGDLPRMLRDLKDRSVLTFGESDDFLKMGGMVRFYIMDKKVQMHVNRTAYVEARLKISSHLLAITTLVSP